MKIRIRGNSVRLRLTKSEVDAFCSTGYYCESTDFGKHKFTYALRATTNVDKLSADFEADTITVYLNKELSASWSKDDRVGFSGEIKTKQGGVISLLVEKDFVCMDETVEDQSDNYPNPKAL